VAQQRSLQAIQARQPGTLITDDNHREFDRASREQRMHARSFVFAVDNFIRELAQLGQESAVAGAVTTALTQFNSDVPGVVDVRDSLHHQDERARGLQRGKPIATQPISMPGIEVEPGAQAMFVGTNIIGNTVANTSSDGRLVQMEMSETTIEHMVKALQTVIDSIPWHSHPAPPMHYPRLHR
jgi:hypothetical protein